MASGCLVITTNEAPMTEVAGSAAYLIKKTQKAGDIETWAVESAKVLLEIVELPPAERNMMGLSKR